ncbi:polyprenol monophosphomannose synthase [bacterium]|nr:polyprenol monophosphomannose synthase [bacterium]
MDQLKTILVIIPTYNEKVNIDKVLERTLMADPRLSVLVVDDGSPDGTGDMVEEYSKTDPRIRLLRRPGKMGLGTAYVAGFKYGLEHQFDAVVEMDADLSHNPADIPRMIKFAENGADFVIGSRYVSGVNVVNWPLQRLLLSYFASIYSRFVTGMPFRDLTAGFALIKRPVLEAIDVDRLRSNGYAFQIEVKYYAWKKGMKLVECPIIFIERADGSSKMNKRIVFEAIYRVWKLRFESMLGKDG